MTRLTKSILVVVAMATASLSAEQASAQDFYQHVDDVALNVQRLAETLQAETRHYVHTPGYAQMVYSTNELRRRATLIHQLAHSHGCQHSMAAHLRILDAQFHRIEGLFDHVEFEASHGHGHVHGSTAHVKTVLNSLEDEIHHLSDDIASLTASLVYRPRVYRPSYNPSGWYQNDCPYSRSRRGHGGISFGDDNWSIRIGF